MQEIPSLLRSFSLSQFVRDYSQFLRKSFGGPAVKAWAHAIGLKTRVVFHNVIKGTRALKPAEISSLQETLDMSHSQMQACGNRSVATVEETEKKFFVSENFFETPLNTIVLNLCGISETMNMEKAKNILSGAFAENEIEESVLRLVSLELVRVEEDGSLVRAFEGSLATAPGIKSVASKAYFRKTYAMADQAWELPLSVRETTAFTFRIDSEDLPKLKDLVRKFRQDITSLSTKEKYNSVYQGTLSVFPIYRAEE